MCLSSQFQLYITFYQIGFHWPYGQYSIVIINHRFNNSCLKRLFLVFIKILTLFRLIAECLTVPLWFKQEAIVLTISSIPLQQLIIMTLSIDIVSTTE